MTPTITWVHGSQEHQLKWVYAATQTSMLEVEGSTDFIVWSSNNIVTIYTPLLVGVAPCIKDRNHIWFHIIQYFQLLLSNELHSATTFGSGSIIDRYFLLYDHN